MITYDSKLHAENIRRINARNDQADIVLKVTTDTARERHELTNMALSNGWQYRATEHHLRDAQPETLQWRLGKVVYEVTL